MFEKTISNLIENQFPQLYQEEGPNFVAFVKAYYEWLETEGNTLYHSRRLLEYRDIDTTVDIFLDQFKNKYLSNIQYETVVDTRRIVKHSLDMYRSKGTERAIDLFFKNIFGVDSSIYYPSVDIFKTSSGKWIEPKYLELSISDNIRSFEGSQIQGVNSGATAFVEKYIRKRKLSSPVYSEIYYISNIVGKFEAGERIKGSFTNVLGPVVVGSLNTVDVTSGSLGYSVGDIVDISSNLNGRSAQGRVTEVFTVTGKVDFTLVNGGWGFNSNSEVLISEKVLLINTPSNNINQFSTINQYTSNLQYTSLTGNQFLPGDIIFRANTSTNVVFSQAKVIDVGAVSNTAGYITILESNDRFANTGRIYKYDSIPNSGGKFVTLPGAFVFGNTVTTANAISKTDYTASANVMAVASNTDILITESIIPLSIGSEVYQYSGTETANGYINTIVYNGTTASVKLTNVNGTFSNTTLLYARSSNATAKISIVETKIGIMNSVGSFISNNGIFYSGNTSAYISSISTGVGASLSLSNTFLNQEVVFLNTDIVGNFLTVNLNSTDYGFSHTGVENINTLLSNAFSYSSETYGSISSLIVTNNGDNYDAIPFVVVYEKDLVSYNKKDFFASIDTISGNFQVGEIIQQGGINKGIVKAGSTSSLLMLTRTTFSDLTTGTIIGLKSGSTANINYVSVDESSKPAGINSVILSSATFGSGSVSKLDIIDSGFGYSEGEIVTFSANNRIAGIATAHTTNQGSKIGFWKENNSLLSSNKYIQDGDYYQEFSYEISSPITLDRYSEILKDTMHIAGTKFFSKFVYESSVISRPTIRSMTVTTGAA